MRTDGSFPEDRGLVSRLLSAQEHRGPDGEGIWAAGPATFGHRRLSIIDLSDNGKQPMSNETGKVWVTFNGEIYNFLPLRSELRQRGHTFRSNSDTEVLIHGYEEWGIEALSSKLRGMFAFALCDLDLSSEGNGAPFLFLVRDRVGIKPLYYVLSQNKIIFGSEVQALVRSGSTTPEIDLDAYAGFFCFGSVPSPKTIYKRVSCLEPGRILAFGRKGTTLKQYWDLSHSQEDWSSDFSSLLGEAVKDHLQADVPVGVFLSSGMDSTGLLALASRYRTDRVSTLTITFVEQDFNEGTEAKAIARAFHADHEEVLITARDFASELPTILNSMDQPTADGVNTYFISKAASERGWKVVLSGLGADEVFLGYSHYRRMGLPGGLLRRYVGAPGWLQQQIGSSAALFGRYHDEERWQRFAYTRFLPQEEGLYLLFRGLFPPGQVSELLGFSAARMEGLLAESFRQLRRNSNQRRSLTDGFHYLEMKRYLHDQLLRDADVFSMAHSLELRVPYLDNEVVDKACLSSAASRLSRNVNKPRLAEAIGHSTIDRAARTTKKGFTFPFSEWMLAHAGELEARSLGSGILDDRVLRRYWQKFREGKMHWSRVWATVAAAHVAQRSTLETAVV
ncbi:MAG: asparagine synthase (glutamine-hydrolyzing) [Acidobacteriota bacterium]|nr:asparagine synthase (glutamine-hydrolyzing) [Acidobacteriota bacterium]